MFTGIIQEIGRVKSAWRKDNLFLSVESSKTASRLKTGDSVAINGVCQTIKEPLGNGFVVEAVEETLSRTNLGSLKAGEPVNLEAPMGVGEMFHGHFVQGHIDCVGKIIAMEPGRGSHRITIEFPKQYGKYIIEKGSIAVDGVSLTIVGSGPSEFSIALIPHTVENTVFKYRRTGEQVNLEFDMIAKYIERMISFGGDSKITSDFLKEHGFG